MKKTVSDDARHAFAKLEKYFPEFTFMAISSGRLFSGSRGQTGRLIEMYAMGLANLFDEYNALGGKMKWTAFIETVEKTARRIHKLELQPDELLEE